MTTTTISDSLLPLKTVNTDTKTSSTKTLTTNYIIYTRTTPKTARICGIKLSLTETTTTKYSTSTINFLNPIDNKLIKLNKINVDDNDDLKINISNLYQKNQNKYFFK